MSDETQTRGAWRLERQITLTIVVSMALQAGAALIWFGSAGERIAQLERRADTQGPVLERLARLEEAAAQSQASLRRIEARLDQRETE
jgi:hypothetical protein